MKGIGYFGADQLSALDDLLQEVAGAPGQRVAIFHHHVLAVWPTGQLPPGANPKRGPAPPLSRTVDGIELLGKLSELSFAVALHGHQHFPAVLRYENCLVAGGPITIVAAGSAGTKGANKQFFVVEIFKDRFSVTSFATNPANPLSFSLDLSRPTVTIALS